MPERLSAIPGFFIAPGKRRLSPWAYVFLFVLCVAAFTPGLVRLPPTDRDESSFAQATKQMIESGNFVDIRLQDKPRYKKPVGIYWLQMASVRLLNPDHLNEIWAYRIPSFLGATLAVLMTAALGSLLFNPMTGLLAAIMMAGCVSFERRGAAGEDRCRAAGLRHGDAICPCAHILRAPQQYAAGCL